ncbi:PucR family transcriptional regulator [Lacrimispora sp. JR3]|uniref:PucR family transcriptional regulator n=1 Tax=Lacrimispora sinapis TaxID=3111456 RepID=UPI003749364E
MDLNQLYREIFKAVSVGGMHNIAKTASVTCGQPVIITDAAFHVLGIFPDTKQNDNIWDTMLMENCAPQDMVMSFYHEKYMEFANSNPESTLVNWGSVAEKPRVMTPILIKDIVEGYAAMMCPAEEYSASHDEAIKIIAKAAAIEMERSTKVNLINKPLAKVFISNLFNNLVRTETQLNTWMSNLGLTEKFHYRLIGIKPVQPSGQGVLKYLISEITAKYPGQISIIRENILYVLLFSSNKNFDQKELESLLRSFDAYCGISREFTDLMKFNSYRQQVETLLHTITKLHPDRTVFEYDGYLLEAMLSIAMEHMDRENFLAPEIKQLREYDGENHAGYLETLKVYLQSMGNIAKSAKILHIHRNTMLYRINRIEELLSMELNQPSQFMRLLLSLYLIDLDQQINP